MSLHVDVFFIKEDGKLKKRVYFTSMYRCDQSVNDVVALSSTVLEKFKEDESKVTNLFAKSDNAACYQGNSSAEAM